MFAFNKDNRWINYVLNTVPVLENRRKVFTVPGELERLAVADVRIFPKHGEVEREVWVHDEQQKLLQL